METPTLITLFLVPFGVLGVFFALPHLTGWHRLAKDFPEREGDAFEVAPAGGWSLRLNGLRYNNCVRIRANERGLSIKVIPPLNWFHGAIFLPWEQISFQEHRETLLRPSTHFRVWAGGKHHHLAVPGGVREPFLSKMRGKESQGLEKEG